MSNVKVNYVVEDSHNLLNKRIQLTMNYMYCDPIDSWEEASQVEERLIYLNKPYVLAEIEVKKFSGYGIFVEKDV